MSDSRYEKLTSKNPDILTVAREAMERFRIAKATGLHPCDLVILPSDHLALAHAVIDLNAEVASYLSEEMTYGQPRFLDARCAELEKVIYALEGKK